MQEKVRFITIDVNAREKLGITNDMYAVADSVYHLSNKPNNPEPGWCDAGKVYLGEHAGVSRSTVFRYLNFLAGKKIVEKGANGLYRTTEKWYKAVVIAKETRKRVRKELEGIKSINDEQ